MVFTIMSSKLMGLHQLEERSKNHPGLQLTLCPDESHQWEEAPLITQVHTQLLSVGTMFEPIFREYICTVTCRLC